jgi:hypothetical protein
MTFRDSWPRWNNINCWSVTPKRPATDSIALPSREGFMPWVDAIQKPSGHVIGMGVGGSFCSMCQWNSTPIGTNCADICAHMDSVFYREACG